MELENKQSVEVESTKRRRTDSESISIEEFRQMTLKQLREQADIRGLSRTGTKKELIERLSEVAEVTVSNDALIEGVYLNLRLIFYLLCFVLGNFNEVLFLYSAEEEKVVEVKEEQIVKVTKKGAAVLDQWLPDYIKANYHVFQQVSLAFVGLC